ncbi:MAG: LacI family DNA-binding transcriptional regulator [Ignavibacteriales bacterium]|nr:LacI family DNA-binding transcriptional regulator [Ignavibacteriales bacterium]
MKHNTLHDIAKKLKVSTSTVSRALSNHPDISKETKEKVKALAEKLNYTPNPIAQSLKKNKTSTIGVLVPEIKHDFFSSAISGIEEAAYHSGYTIIVCQSNESYEREVINTNALMNHRVAGMIVSISQQTTTGEHFKKLIDRNIPLVFFDRVCEDVDANKVIIDDEKSAYIAVQHLIEKGYKKIAHFAGPKDLSICKKRLRGYKEALLENNLPFREEYVLHGGMHETDGYNSMDTLLKKNIVPDAVFCVNDPVAIGAYQRIKEAGLKIPDDIGIVGFSNNKITTLVEPQITTVNQPSFEMGKKSAEILIEMIDNPDKIKEPQTIIVETNLIVRNST